MQWVVCLKVLNGLAFSEYCENYREFTIKIKINVKLTALNMAHLYIFTLFRCVVWNSDQKRTLVVTKDGHDDVKRYWRQHSRR